METVANQTHSTGLDPSLPQANTLVAQEVPLSSLLPIQAEGASTPYLKELESADRDQLPPVETVLYGDQLLLIDGTNRAVRFHLDGAAVIRAFVAKEDADLRQLKSPLAKSSKTIRDVYETYEQSLLPQLKAANITGVASLPQHNSYTRTHVVAPVEEPVHIPESDLGITVPM